MNKYEEELNYVKNYLENELGYKVAYIALYGSQNYNLDIKDGEFKSDLDMKAIIVPTLKELVKNSKPVSETIEINHKLNYYMIEKIDLKDIREYFKILEKANPAYLEIFYTDYYLVDDEFKDEFDIIFDNIWEYTYINRAKMVRAIYGMAMEKLHALKHEYPSKLEIIDKYDYDPKQAHHLVRLQIMLDRYYERNIKGMNYNYKGAIWHDKSNYNNESEINYLMRIKEAWYSLETIEDKCKYTINIMKKKRDKILENIDESKIDYSVNYMVRNLVNEIVEKSIIKNIKED